MDFPLLIVIFNPCVRRDGPGGKRNFAVLGKGDAGSSSGPDTRNFLLPGTTSVAITPLSRGQMGRTHHPPPLACFMIKLMQRGPEIVAEWEGKMGIRLERSGGLIFIKGTPDAPEPPVNKYATVGLWLALVLFVGGVLFIGPHSLTMADITHTFKSLLAAVHY